MNEWKVGQNRTKFKIRDTTKIQIKKKSEYQVILQRQGRRRALAVNRQTSFQGKPHFIMIQMSLAYLETVHSRWRWVPALRGFLHLRRHHQRDWMLAQNSVTWLQLLSTKTTKKKWCLATNSNRINQYNYNNRNNNDEINPIPVNWSKSTGMWILLVLLVEVGLSRFH